MTNQPLFSVLMANYNNGKYLMDAIESVRQQTYTNWEIILVDDCSTDNSHELYKELKRDERIHIFLNEQNKGCGYTKRRCAELANGEICGFLDPDDALMENALEVMIGQFKQYDNLSLVYSQSYFVDENLHVIADSAWQKEIPNGLSFMEYGQCAIFHFVAFNKLMYSRTEGIRIDAKRAVDYSLYYLMEEVGLIRFVPAHLYLYRNNTGANISIGKKNALRAKLWELLLMEDACVRRKLDIETYLTPRLEEFVSWCQYESYESGRTSIKSTKTYQLGNTILYPLKWIRSIFYKLSRG
jgi:glycosyltransferase involved in cell wall biosynthesis